MIFRENFGGFTGKWRKEYSAFAHLFLNLQNSGKLKIIIWIRVKKLSELRNSGCDLIEMISYGAHG